MSIFSKINSLFLAVAVVFITTGQIQPSPGSGPIFPQPDGTESPAYLGISSHNIWGVLNLDSSSSINVFSNSDSEEDRKNNSKKVTARESVLTKISSLYLLFTKDIDHSPSVRELLYPFYFYF